MTLNTRTPELLERVKLIFITKNAAIMYGMYIINGVHGPKPRSSGGNTSCNLQVSALIPRPVFSGMERMCQGHGSNKNSHPPVLVWKRLCNHQFVYNQISSRGVFGISHFKLHSFAVATIECFFYRGSIMAIIHRLFIMIYGSLQAEFMETKYNSHINRRGTYIFGKIVVNISKSINTNNQTFGGCETLLDLTCHVFSLHWKQNFLLHSLHYQLLHGRGISRGNI